MAYRTLPIDAPDNAIKDLVVEWNELLAQKRYAEALSMFPQCCHELTWTPENLGNIISGYGVLDNDDETLEHTLKHHNVSRFEITTLINRPDYKQIYDDCIDVNRNSLYGLNPEHYLGMVHFEDVPLSGFRSDLTARFHIKKIGLKELTLEFVDIHVM